MKRKILISLFLSIFGIMVIFSAPKEKMEVTWGAKKTNHQVVSNDHLRLLWERPIYTGIEGLGVPCVAMDERVYVTGGEEQITRMSVIAMDKEGKTEWVIDGDLSITASETRLFNADRQTVTSISPKTGEIIWSTFIREARKVIDIWYFEDKIFVNATGYPFFVLSPEDGRIIAKYSSVEGFHGDYPNVSFYVNQNFPALPVGDDLIFQGGGITYNLSRGKMNIKQNICEIENDSISNAALIGNQLFYISKDDVIKTVSADTGELLYETVIEPSIDFFNLDKWVQHDGYYVCSDEKNHLLYVILGDSRQMFALSVVE